MGFIILDTELCLCRNETKKLASSVTMGHGDGRLPSDVKVGLQTNGVKLSAASDLQTLGSDNLLSGSSNR